MAIRVGIMGYGNLGRGVELAVRANDDMELSAVFTRRSPDNVKILSDAPVVKENEASAWRDKIDVMILCGGSYKDLPAQTPIFAEMFNVVDSFDTHADIPKHFANVDKAAKKGNHVGIISVGWDPGLFSLARVYSAAVLPNGQDYTFWGRGVSQGHSDAIRRVKGVKDARQYTVPIENALNAVRSGKNPELTAREKHLRECYVVLEESADAAEVANAIKTMPNYFSDYDTAVNFIDEEELKNNHGGLAHGGFVIRSGRTGENEEHNHVVEFNLKLDSNPEFTAGVLAAYARAAYRMSAEGQRGAKTVLDVAPAYLSPLGGDELRHKFI